MTDNHADFKHGKHPNSKKVKDDISGIIFESAVDYAEYIKKRPDTVSSWLRGDYKFPEGYSAHYMT